MKPVVVTVNDRMQRGYSYVLTEPAARCFDPAFRPELTPPLMLSLGVFGGKYMTDCAAEFPRSWFDGSQTVAAGDPTRRSTILASTRGQSLGEWRRRGWIHPDDPRGWFQWYCRYYQGRRMADEDARQIGRWRAMRRHIQQVRRNCEAGDLFCRPRQRQALLHWAYDSRLI